MCTPRLGTGRRSIGEPWGTFFTAFAAAAGLLASVLPVPASGQIVPGFALPADPAPNPEAVRREATGRELLRRLHQANDLLGQAAYVEGVRLLQSILDTDEDAFIADKEQSARETSLKFETQKTLGALPAAGRQAYEKQYGPVARRLLVEAIAASDFERLASVARQYFHTQAGYEAAYRLASDDLDHQRALSAALGFERLRNTPQADDQFEPLLSIKAALAWRRTGRDDKAREALASMRARYRQNEVSLGGRDVPLFSDANESLDWLAATLGGLGQPVPAGPEQWSMPRGDARRNASSSAGTPHLNRGWRASTIEQSTKSAQYDELLAAAVSDRRGPSQLAGEAPFRGLPSGQPLIVDDLVIVHGLSDLRAYSAVTGRLVWAAAEKDQFLLDVLRSEENIQGSGQSMLSQVVSYRGWSDITWGTISSDGESVFCIEDGGLNGALIVNPGRVAAFREYNRLVAYDVRTGRALWEAGGPRTDQSDERTGMFFLGAPLVLDRRLYCLAETGGDVRLLALEARTGRTEWSQLLTDTPTPLGDLYRRQSGLSPAYDGGILVCPVGSDQTVAIDLVNRTLLWRYRYRPASDGFDARRLQALVAQQQRAPGTMLDQNLWLDSGPIISHARVLLTPRDSGELYCLNLLDGTLAWKVPRGEALFVAGIHRDKALVVGRTFVQAFALADGRPAWPEPATVPAPSGRGFLAGDRYYLPLSTAEVAALDLRDGRIALRQQSLERRIPGNLVGVQGTIISQGVDFVESYRQLDSLEAEVADSLKSDPDDATALALRGEIRLGQGKLREGYEDLQRARSLKPGEDRVRELLLRSVLEGLRVDFAANRPLVHDVDALLTTPEERALYHWACAQGLLKTGQPRAAFSALLNFADLSVDDSVLERVESTLVVRRDRLVRSRTRGLMASAGESDRRKMRAELSALAGALDAGDAAGRRRLLDCFEPALDTADLRRMVVDAAPGNDRLAEEFRLLRLINGSEQGVAARAAARLAERMLTAGRPRDAAALLAQIARDWPDVEALEGHTGRTLAALWMERPEMALAVRDKLAWPAGWIQIERVKEAPVMPGGRAYPVTFEGPRGPFFADTSLEISSRLQDFLVRDGLGRPLWPKPVSLDAAVAVFGTQLYRASTWGHLVVISTPSQILAVDSLGTAERPVPRVLWEIDLKDQAAGPIAIPGMRNFRRRMPLNQVAVPSGTLGPVTGEYVAVQRGEKLMALEPLTKKPLWIREGIRDGSDLFGDEAALVVMPPNSNEASVYRALDGELIGLRTLPPAKARLDTFGRHVITLQPVRQGLELALYDPVADQYVWQRMFAAESQATVVEGEEVAILEPAGRFSIISLADGRVRWTSTVEATSPAVDQLLVLRSRERYVVFCNERIEDNPGWPAPPPPGVRINGDVHCFDRASGRSLWNRNVRIERQGLDVSQPSELPVLTFWCPTDERPRNGGNALPSYQLLCLDLRSGRTLINERVNDAIFHVDFKAQPAENRLDLGLVRSALRLTFTDKPWPE